MQTRLADLNVCERCNIQLQKKLLTNADIRTSSCCRPLPSYDGSPVIKNSDLKCTLRAVSKSACQCRGIMYILKRNVVNFGTYLV